MKEENNFEVLSAAKDLWKITLNVRNNVTEVSVCYKINIVLQIISNIYIYESEYAYLLSEIGDRQAFNESIHIVKKKV